MQGWVDLEKKKAPTESTVHSGPTSGPSPHRVGSKTLAQSIKVFAYLSTETEFGVDDKNAEQ